MVYCRKYWPKETIAPVLHMLKDHAADFIERSSPGHGVYGEHGAESIHKIFTAKNILPSATSHDTSAEYPKKNILD